jgi:hypothetical protein
LSNIIICPRFIIAQTISFAAIVTNAGIICFTMDIFDTDDQTKVWFFAGYQYLNFGLTLLFAYLIEDTPLEVRHFRYISVVMLLLLLKLWNMM